MLLIKIFCKKLLILKLINQFFGIVGVEAGSGPGHGQLRGDEGGGADPAHRSLRLLTYQGNPACPSIIFSL